MPCSTFLPVALVASPLILPNCIYSASICTTTAISEGFPRDKGVYFTSIHSYLQNDVISLSHVCQEKTKLNSLNGIWKHNTFLLFGIIQPITLYPAVPVLWCPPLRDVTLSRATGRYCLDLEENFSISTTGKVIQLLQLLIFCICNGCFCRYPHFWGTGYCRSNVTVFFWLSFSSAPSTLESPAGVEQTL